MGWSSARKPGSLLKVWRSSSRLVAATSAVRPEETIQRETSFLRASSWVTTVSASRMKFSITRFWRPRIREHLARLAQAGMRAP